MAFISQQEVRLVYVCVCKKIIILIIKRGNGGWVGNVYDSLLFVGLLLFVAHHI